MTTGEVRVSMVVRGDRMCACMCVCVTIRVASSPWYLVDIAIYPPHTGDGEGGLEKVVVCECE